MCDVCVSCSKLIKTNHKQIYCKICKLYVHKKCTKLKRKELQRLDVNDWTCLKCKDNKNKNVDPGNDEPIGPVDFTNVDFEKYENMLFNPIRYQNTLEKMEEDNDIIQPNLSKYITPDQFKDEFLSTDYDFTILNENIRSLSKNFPKLKECIESLNHNFTIIGLSETHLKDEPHTYYNLPGYSMEYTNRINRDKGGVCMYISDNVKYKVRHDLCRATSNYESCFIEIENCKFKNKIVGIIYRAHTPIDDFIDEIKPVFELITKEKKICHIMGDFNIDL